MASIKSLQKIAEKNPIGFLESELSFGKYSITEKIDAHSIQIEKRGTSVIIWKRNGSQLLTKIDRILDIRWKPLMLWVLANKNKFSENFVYHIDYLPYHRVNQVHYERLPENYVFLNSVHSKNGVYTQYDTVERVAKDLGVTPNSKIKIVNHIEVRQKLIELSQTSLDSGINSTYKESFDGLKRALNVSHEVEGFIISTDSFTAKIMSPEWKETKKEEPNIQYQLLTSMMMEFFIEKMPNLNIEFTEKIQDRRYVELINQVFLRWIKVPDNLIKIEKPEFIGDLNLKEVSGDVRAVISKDDVLQMHYSIMMNAFRKNKNRDWGIFNEEKRAQWNLLIYKINKYIEKREGIKPFAEYKNKFY